MRSCLVVLALGACGFTPGVAFDAGTASTDATADAGLDGIDASPPIMTVPRTRQIDINDTGFVGGPYTSFPLLISLEETWLRSTASGGDVARADGFDIYFSSDAEGESRLSHEVETYAPATGRLVAWVKIPALTQGTVLYLHYGDPTITTSQQNIADVWSNGFAYVNHLGGAGDATGQSTNTPTNVSTEVGKIGSGGGFDGTTSTYNAGSAAAIANIFTGTGVVEAWFYADTYGGGTFARLFDKGEWSVLLNGASDNNTLGLIHSASSQTGQWYASVDSVSLGAWHHVAIVYNKDSSLNDPLIYIDGQSRTVLIPDFPSGTLSSDTASTLYIGNRADGTRAFDGILDELRMSSSSRSGAWIATSYRNQFDPAAFYTVSAPL